MIGFYIVEFEQNGEDRARYGDNLISDLAQNLKSIKGIDKRSLFRFRQFYLEYPQIYDAFSNMILAENQYYKPIIEKVGSVTPQLIQKVGSPNPLLKEKQSLTWYKVATKANWKNYIEIKKYFYSDNCIQDCLLVFNIKGNKYRLVVDFNFKLQWAFIVFIGTHAEYSKKVF